MGDACGNQIPSAEATAWDQCARGMDISGNLYQFRTFFYKLDAFEMKHSTHTNCSNKWI